MLSLNSRNQLLAASTVFAGTVNSVNVRPVEIFRQAVQVNPPPVSSWCTTTLPETPIQALRTWR